TADQYLNSFPTRRSSDLARRTDIEDKIESLDVSKEMLIAKEDTVVTLTKEGYVKRTSLRSYNASNPHELGMREGDNPLFIGMSRSEEHTSELQSRFDLVC